MLLRVITNITKWLHQYTATVGPTCSPVCTTFDIKLLYCWYVLCQSCIFVKGDLGCQTIESVDAGSAFAWDRLRTLRMGITGAFVMAPMSFSWNLYAERVAPGTSWRAILTKMGFSIAVLPPMVRNTVPMVDTTGMVTFSFVYI